MSWTSEDVAKLKKAIATGARSVSYDTGRVEYRSLAEMKATLEMMEAEVYGARSRRTLGVFSRGVARGE